MKIYRKKIQLIDIELDNSSIYKYTIMGDEMCNLSFVYDSYVDFQIGDYLEYEGQRYVINTPYTLKKIANNEYNYNIKFEGIKYELSKVLLKLDGALEFPVNFTIEQLLDLVLININEISDIEWVKGVCSITAFKDLQITNENCLQVLNRVCLLFDVEFEVIPTEDTYTINIRDVIGVYEGVELAYKSGIFDVNKTPISDSNIITKLYVSGASKNIPEDYEKNRLTIPPLTNNVEKYGINEHSVTYEDIYPKFEGSVVVAGTTTFVDNKIDFNLNNYLLPGIAAKCVFLSGDLSGYSFDIVSYNSSTKTVEIATLKDDIGQELPSTSLKLNIGDRYTFVDIYMPIAYVEDAEEQLAAEGTIFLQKYSNPIVKYTITIDARYLRKHEIIISTGQKIKLVLNDFSFSEILRVYSLTRSLANPYQYTMELTDNLQTSRMLKLIYGQYDIDKRLNEYKKELRIIKNN